MFPRIRLNLSLDMPSCLKQLELLSNKNLPQWRSEKPAKWLDLEEIFSIGQKLKIRWGSILHKILKLICEDTNSRPSEPVPMLYHLCHLCHQYSMQMRVTWVLKSYLGTPAQRNDIEMRKDPKQEFFRQLPVDQGLLVLGEDAGQLPAGVLVSVGRGRLVLAAVEVVVGGSGCALRVAELPRTAVHICQLLGRVPHHNSTTATSNDLNLDQKNGLCLICIILRLNIFYC